MVRALVLCLALALAGCVTARGSFCDVAKPIRLSEAAIAAMSDSEVAAALALNLKGQKICRWRP